MSILGWLWLKSCWYCQKRSLSRVNSNGLWYCNSCGEYFNLSCGDYTPCGHDIYSVSTKRQSVTFASRNSRKYKQSNILCAICNHNQDMIVKMLSNYEDQTDNKKRLDLFRKELEVKYPLCINCKVLVDNKISVQDRKIREKALKALNSLKPLENRPLFLKTFLFIITYWTVIIAYPELVFIELLMILVNWLLFRRSLLLLVQIGLFWWDDWYLRFCFPILLLFSAFGGRQKENSSLRIMKEILKSEKSNNTLTDPTVNPVEVENLNFNSMSFGFGDKSLTPIKPSRTKAVDENRVSGVLFSPSKFVLETGLEESFQNIQIIEEKSYLFHWIFIYLLRIVSFISFHVKLFVILVFKSGCFSSIRHCLLRSEINDGFYFSSSHQATSRVSWLSVECRFYCSRYHFDGNKQEDSLAPYFIFRHPWPCLF